MAFLAKSSPLQRKGQRYERRMASRKVKQEADRRARQEDAQRRREAFARDGGRCRATGARLKLQTDNPWQLAHLHHIVFRSAGGSDELPNRIILSPEFHERIHAHEIDCWGDGNATVYFLERNLETGKVLRQWSSEPTQVTA